MGRLLKDSLTEFRGACPKLQNLAGLFGSRLSVLPLCITGRPPGIKGSGRFFQEGAEDAPKAAKAALPGQRRHAPCKAVSKEKDASALPERKLFESSCRIPDASGFLQNLIAGTVFPGFTIID